MNADRWADAAPVGHRAALCLRCLRRARCGGSAGFQLEQVNRPGDGLSEQPEIRRQHVMQITVDKCRFGHDLMLGPWYDTSSASLAPSTRAPPCRMRRRQGVVVLGSPRVVK